MAKDVVLYLISSWMRQSSLRQVQLDEQHHTCSSVSLLFQRADVGIPGSIAGPKNLLRSRVRPFDQIMEGGNTHYQKYSEPRNGIWSRSAGSLAVNTRPNTTEPRASDPNLRRCCDNRVLRRRLNLYPTGAIMVALRKYGANVAFIG